MRVYKVLLVVLSVFIFSACYTNIIEGNDMGETVVEEYDDITINCKLDFGENDEVEGLKAVTTTNEWDIDDTEFEISSLSGKIPMTVFIVDDEAEKVIMLSRERHTDGKLVTVDAVSTSIALVTMYHALLPVLGEDYETIVAYVKDLPSFPGLVNIVQESINKREDLFNVDNTLLLNAINNTLEDLYQKLTDNFPLKRVVPSISKSGINMDQYPLHILLYDDCLTLQTTGLTPSYFGEYTRTYDSFIEKVDDLTIPSCENEFESVLDFYADGFKSLFNIGTQSSNHYGEEEYAYFNNIGEYSFSLELDKTEAWLKMIDYFIGTFWISMDSDLKRQFKAIFIENIPNVYSDILNGEYSLETGVSLVYDGVDTILKGLKGTGLSSILSVKYVAKFFSFASKLKNGLTEICYVYYFLKAPEHISFKICHQENNTEDCTTAMIKIVGGNNQSGEVGQRLLEPLAIEYVSYNAEGEQVSTAIGKDIKFVVTQGDGSVSESLVHAVSGQASVWWTLGDGIAGDIQKVEAFVVSSIDPDVIISNIVEFNATVKSPQDITVRLDWQKLSGKTDIDLHVVDPYGEEIYYLNSFSESGGWLDRDDIVGPGPEHISWNVAPAGTYTVKVHYYDSDSRAVTTYQVSIKVNGVTKYYSGSIAYHQEVTIAEFVVPLVSEARSNIFDCIKDKLVIKNNKIYPLK